MTMTTAENQYMTRQPRSCEKIVLIQGLQGEGDGLESMIQYV
jgi:hypothetical protein